MSVTTVYVVRWDDPDRYQILLYDLPEVPSALKLFQGVSKAEGWIAPPVYSYEPRREAPDFWHLVGSGTIVMRPAVVEALGGYIHPAGELLPLRLVGHDEELVAFNILRDVDCLNPDAYSLDELRLYTDFLPHRLPESGFFKIPQMDDLEIFVLERSDDPETLRQAIERNGFRGLRFEPVWASDGSVPQVNLFGL